MILVVGMLLIWVSPPADEDPNLDLIVDSASTRHESRGLHYTLDHPELDESQPPRHSILKRG